MSASGDGTAPPFTNATRARLVAAYEACVVSDLARAAVPVGWGELSSDGTVHAPGALLADARETLRAAHRSLEAAVVFERLGGASWRTVSRALGTTEDGARRRFLGAESSFRQELLRPANCVGADAGARWWRSYLVHEPEQLALDLDDWGNQRSGGSSAGPTPVSGGLARAEG